MYPHPLLWPPARELRDLFGPSLANASYLINWSQKHRYIYVETPKVACSSIKLSLQRIELDDRAYVPSDIHKRAQSPLLSVRARPLRFLRALRSSAYFRFCFVRDPYARVLSAYLDKLVRNERERPQSLASLGLAPDAQPSFREFLEALERTEPSKFDVHWARQVDLLTPKLVAYDFIGRFENFREDFSTVLGRIGRGPDWIADARQHRTDASAQLSQWIGPAERALIERIFAADFDAYGYSRGLAGPADA
ncbi:MAG TPA: sulfotransferase family protein [Rhizomicrobium sp.]|jgi:hypothetical protein|nr:sulfotransferase family protein [Rhizomicrobium sp.]